MFVVNLLPYAIVSRRVPAQSCHVRDAHHPKYHQWPEGIRDNPGVEIHAWPQTPRGHQESDIEIDNVETAQECEAHPWIGGIGHRCKLRGRENSQKERRFLKSAYTRKRGCLARDRNETLTRQALSRTASLFVE